MAVYRYTLLCHECKYEFHRNSPYFPPCPKCKSKDLLCIDTFGGHYWNLGDGELEPYVASIETPPWPETDPVVVQQELRRWSETSERLRRASEEFYSEPYGWPELVGSVLTAVVWWAGIGALLGWVWSSALNVSSLLVVIVSAALGGGIIGTFQGLIVGSRHQRQLRQGSGLFTSYVFMRFASIIAILGGVVWGVRSIISA
jgi:hypothetical protein